MKGGPLLAEAIEAYASGDYVDICTWTQRSHGGNGIFEAWDVIRIESIPHEVREVAERLYATIMAQDAEPLDLTRTEVNPGGRCYKEGGRGRALRYGLAPEVGTILRWGVKSTSAHPGWEYRVACDEAPGMNCVGNWNGRTLVRDGAEVIAYHIKGATRYIDMSEHSEWDQAEAIVAGDYMVKAVRRETYTTDVGTYDFVKVSPRQYALLHGQELEPFVSKRGEDMVRFGTHVYPASDMDKPTMQTSEEIMGTVPIIHIYLEELR